MPETGKYVYILESLPFPGKRYTGVTMNLKSRIAAHNAGQSAYTSRYKPWKISTAIWFEDNKKADAFEKYLKSGSGRAFSKRHF